MIVNLQIEGEHPYCGPNGKLEDVSGYSYDPHLFMAEDVKVKLAGWKDMAVPESINFVLDIVKEMAQFIRDKEQKVLVHCHAGYGRTGVVIVCYLLYIGAGNVSDVVDLIRVKRPPCVQSNDQLNFCKKFSRCSFLKRHKQSAPFVH